MDLAQTLVRSVLRAFYETRHILVIDALVIHQCLRDDELSYLISMNTKDLHKLCAALRDARFLVVHTRSELKEGQQRPVNRTYYYIDYRQAIDAIKWRVYKLDKDMQGITVPASERKEYFCPLCKAEWTQMEVLDNFGPNGFLCHRCNSVLTHDVERQSGGHEKSTRLNNQIRFITDLLPKIDSVIVPESTFDLAFSIRRPVERPDSHPGSNSVPVDASMKPTAVKGLTNTGPISLEVNISMSEGPTEAEKEAERLRREKIAKQNALPSWMSNSTVTGESFSATPVAGIAAEEKDEADSKNLAGKESTDANEHAELDDYFARLKAEQAAEAARKAALEAEDSGSDEEEDEGDFEDVVGTGTSSAVGTPASTGPTSNLPVAPSPLRQSSVPAKREAPASTLATDVNSPSKSDHVDERPSKKVKIEKPAAEDGESEEEEDVDFVDV
ncbi:Transcription initiation factor iie subunit alpha [Pleurostoma richardsiae]|uniref:Transcription initiation factor iie subunit alpha n=1 Tax=Pleurostoma richardsiae TaxID=41990 RepID=A0AA38RUK0_9PEZI|nr:Transcription initiation factor iie subunit alpha [Pleurostoma richardsiae]